MNDTALATDEQIHTFAATVRQHLDDLPADELDEIVGGLVADLAEQAADNDGVLDVRDPAAYAEELRTAAGLPPRSESRRRPALRERFASWRAGTAESIRRSAFGAWSIELLGSLGPVWWVLRAFGLWGAFSIVVALLNPNGPWDWRITPNSLLEWLTLLVLLVVSVQWGRGRWVPKGIFRHVRTIATVIALVLLPAVLYSLFTPDVRYIDNTSAQQGLTLDGVQIDNIFAYDADGNPIDQVQLFTNRGTPINLYGQSGASRIGSDGESEFGVFNDGSRATIPGEDYRGKSVWNVYPLDEAKLDPSTFEPDASAAKRPTPPFQKAPSLDAASATPTPTPDTVPAPVETPAP